MVHLTLSSAIPASPSEVCQHVTAVGEEGPLVTVFQDKYGSLLSCQGNVFVAQEKRDPALDDGEVAVIWRCTFTYPSSRVMEAMDSGWANRVDQIWPATGGTRWSICWDTRAEGIRGVAQYLMFALIGRRRLRRAIVEPVKEHFQSP